MPALIGGLLGVAGGAVGAWAGMSANKGGLCCEAGVTGIAGGILVVATLFAWFGTVIFADLCDDYTCDGSCYTSGVFSVSFECTKPNVCCDCTDSNYLYAACKESID